jgi:hypothetical protein
MLNKLTAACKLCKICATEGEELQGGKLFILHSPGSRFLVIHGMTFEESTALYDKLGRVTVTAPKRCTTSSALASSTCGVYTKLLLKLFPIVWCDEAGAAQLNLDFVDGSEQRIEGVVILMGTSPFNDVKRLQGLEKNYQGLQPLIGDEHVSDH